MDIGAHAVGNTDTHDAFRIMVDIGCKRRWWRWFGIGCVGRSRSRYGNGWRIRWSIRRRWGWCRGWGRIRRTGAGRCRCWGKGRRVDIDDQAVVPAAAVVVIDSYRDGEIATGRIGVIAADAATHSRNTVRWTAIAPVNGCRMSS